MAQRDIIVIGASAGGVEALIRLARDLPAGLPAAVFVVLHLSSGVKSLLPEILTRSGPLPATHPEDGERIRPGRIYVAPPDFHMLVKDGRVSLVGGPVENRHRPAINPLFRTAARSFGQRVIGVILSGADDDGASGLAIVAQHGGLAIVQDPADAPYPRMPASAIDAANVDHVLPLADIGCELGRLVGRRAGKEVSLSGKQDTPQDPVEMDKEALHEFTETFPASGFSCPSCGGVLWDAHESDVPRFQCRVGHIFSANGLSEAQQDELESALWEALRSAEENVDLQERLAERVRRLGHNNSVRRFEDNAREARRRADLLRSVLTDATPPSASDATRARDPAAT